MGGAVEKWGYRCMGYCLIGGYKRFVHGWGMFVVWVDCISLDFSNFPL